MDQRHFVFISSLLHPGHDSGHAGWDLPTENRNRKTELYVHLIRIISNTTLKSSLITILIIERSGSLKPVRYLEADKGADPLPSETWHSIENKVRIISNQEEWNYSRE